MTGCRRRRSSPRAPRPSADPSTSFSSTGRSTRSGPTDRSRARPVARGRRPDGRRRRGAACPRPGGLGRDLARCQGARRGRHRGLLAVHGPAGPRAARPRPSGRWRRGHHGIPPRGRRGPVVFICRWRPIPWSLELRPGRRPRALVPDAHREHRAGHQELPPGRASNCSPPTGLVKDFAAWSGRQATRWSTRPSRVGSTASSSAGSEASP